MNNLKVFLIEYWYSRGKTDADLARTLGVDHSLVSKWVNGVVEPTWERKIQIAKALGVDSRLIYPDKNGIREKQKDGGKVGGDGNES